MPLLYIIKSKSKKEINMRSLYNIEKRTTMLSIWFSQKPLWVSIIILFISLFIFSLSVAIISVITDNDYTHITKDIISDRSSEVIFSCIIAPIVETFMLYTLLYLINRFFTKSIVVQILIPFIIFGMLHNYSCLYVFNGICVGVVFCFGLYLYYHTKKFSIAFWSIVFVHSLKNLVAIVSS